MRKFLAILFFIISPLSLCLAQQAAKISFESHRFNFGTFARTDSQKTYAFKFKNTGDAKLVIDHLSVGCPCTTAKYSKKTFLPGESGEIVATFDGSHQSLGPFDIEIIVASNATTKYVRLILSGNLVATQDEVLAAQKPTSSPAVDTLSTQDSWLQRLKTKLKHLFGTTD